MSESSSLWEIHAERISLKGQVTQRIRLGESWTQDLRLRKPLIHSWRREAGANDSSLRGIQAQRIHRVRVQLRKTWTEDVRLRQTWTLSERGVHGRKSKAHSIRRGNARGLLIALRSQRRHWICLGERGGESACLGEHLRHLARLGSCRCILRKTCLRERRDLRRALN